MQDIKIQPLDLIGSESDLINKTKRLEQVVDNLMKKPRGPERWKEALKLYVGLNLSATPNMTAAEEVYYVIKDNEQQRREQINVYGKSSDSNSDLRIQLNMPSGFKTLLNLVDPQINSKQNLVKLRKAFPEFVISEKY